jgi:hypothetical protein
MAKYRNGFVSNSSSTAFIITNLIDTPKQLTDFVKENPQLIKLYREKYRWAADKKCNQRNLIASAEDLETTLLPGDNYCIFGDEQWTLIGAVFDYILRDGGSSKSFTWVLKEYLR